MSTKQNLPEVATRSPRAGWGLACGLIAAISAIPFVPGPYFEFLFGAAAIVLGSLGLQDASHGMRGKGMALSAIALGAIAIVYKIVVQF